MLNTKANVNVNLLLMMLDAGLPRSHLLKVVHDFVPNNTIFRLLILWKEILDFCKMSWCRRCHRRCGGTKDIEHRSFH